MYHVFSYAKIVDINVVGYGQCWVENAKDEIEALEKCREWVKENVGESAVISSNYIIVSTLESKQLAEVRQTAFDAYADSFDIIAEIGLNKFDQLRRQNIQREFSKLLKIGEFCQSIHSDQYIPSRNSELISMLKEKNA